ncbi:MAG TPA: hypothetical protein VFE52_08530 [Devosia sp.]|nr:hypothetical protein [Devosia sp.]
MTRLDRKAEIASYLAQWNSAPLGAAVLLNHEIDSHRRIVWRIPQDDADACIAWIEKDRALLELQADALAQMKVSKRSDDDLAKMIEATVHSECGANAVTGQDNELGYSYGFFHVRNIATAVVEKLRSEGIIR